MICLKCGCKNDLGAKFCTHCGEPTPISDSSKTAKITVKREKKMYGFAISFEVWIDDVRLGTLKNDTTLTAPVSYGTHEVKLTSTEKDVIEVVELNENKNSVTIDIVAKTGLIAAKPKVTEVKYSNE